jgi:TolB-like protein/Tfp pilus assembly protein PilF
MTVKGFLAQLQQRRVTRVAAIYATAAFALLQLADIMFPKIGLNENAITLVLVLAAAGFPLSLILSWIFNFTAEGVTKTWETQISAEIEQFHLRPIPLLAVLASLLLFAVVAYLYLQRLSENRLSLFNDEAAPLAVVSAPPPVAPEDRGRASIAVLPFLNFSDVAQMNHFGDGLAEEILNMLSRLDELRVAARTSSFYFKDKDFDIPTIARHLGVRYVLEGSVRHSGERIRVTAQLIDASNGFHLWSDTFDRDPSNIFQVQDEISREVVKNLKLYLSPRSKGLLERGVNVDPIAYEYYLRGRDYLRNPRDASTLQNAERMFSKAVTLSPGFADAYAGLCDAQLQQFFTDQEKGRFTAAEEACQRAQAVDNDSSAVSVALGNLYRASGQFTLAQREFNRALSLQSTAVDAYLGLAETYQSEGKYALAEQTLAQAIELEPNNWAASMAMGKFLLGTGRMEESIRYFERIDDLMPESSAAANNLGSAYFLTGRFEDAAAAWEKALRRQPMATVYANLGSSYFFMGRFDEAADTYKKALEMAPESYENWGNLADAYRHSPTQSALAPAAYARAIGLAKQHLQINSSNAVAIATLGHYLACVGEREEAKENIGLAQRLAPKEMLVYYFSATALCALGEPEKALGAVRVALSLGYPAEMVDVDAGLSSLKKLPTYGAVLAAVAPIHPSDGKKENTQ